MQISNQNDLKTLSKLVLIWSGGITNHSIALINLLPADQINWQMGRGRRSWGKKTMFSEGFGGIYVVQFIRTVSSKDVNPRFRSLSILSLVACILQYVIVATYTLLLPIRLYCCKFLIINNYPIGDCLLELYFSFRVVWSFLSYPSLPSMCALHK